MQLNAWKFGLIVFSLAFFQARAVDLVLTQDINAVTILPFRLLALNGAGIVVLDNGDTWRIDAVGEPPQYIERFQKSWVRSLGGALYLIDDLYPITTSNGMPGNIEEIKSNVDNAPSPVVMSGNVAYQIFQDSYDQRASRKRALYRFENGDYNVATNFFANGLQPAMDFDVYRGLPVFSTKRGSIVTITNLADIDVSLCEDSDCGVYRLLPTARDMFFIHNEVELEYWPGWDVWLPSAVGHWLWRLVPPEELPGVDSGYRAEPVPRPDTLISFNSDSPRVLGNRVIFAAEHSTFGYEMWASDGTLENTEVLIDANPGAAGGIRTPPVRIGDRLAYIAYTGSETLAIVSTDGTPTGTFLLPAPQDKPLTRNDVLHAVGDEILVSSTTYCPYLVHSATGDLREVILPDDGCAQKVAEVQSFTGGWLVLFKGGSRVYAMADLSGPATLSVAFESVLTKDAAVAKFVGVNGAFFSAGSGSAGLTQFNGLEVVARGGPGSPSAARGINGQLQLEYRPDSVFGSECIMVDPLNLEQTFTRVRTGSNSWGELAGIQYSWYYGDPLRPYHLGCWSHPTGFQERVVSAYRYPGAPLGAAGPYTYTQMDSLALDGPGDAAVVRFGVTGDIKVLTPPLGDYQRVDASRLAVLGDDLVFAYQRDRGSDPAEIRITETLPSSSHVVRIVPERLYGIAPSIQLGSPPVAWFLARTVTDKVNQLWRTDGTPDGTVMRYAGPPETTAGTLFQVNGRVCFTIVAADALVLHAYDDAGSNTTDLSTLGEFTSTKTLHQTPARTWLEAVRSDGTRALLETGGTADSTRVVAELPGLARGVVGHTLYGTYNTEETGEEVWALPLDAPPEITRFDTAPGFFNGSVMEISFNKLKWGSAGGWAYFYLDDHVHGREWWASYGGAALAQVTVYRAEPQERTASFTVRFSEPVLNVDITDFEGVRSDYLDVALTGFLAISPTEYRVSVSVDRGDGTVGIHLREPNDITDANGFPLGPVTDIGVDGINGPAVALGPSRVPHSIDTNGDFRVDISELLRCIQLYNSDGLYCGYSADGVAVIDPHEYMYCDPYDLDYAPADNIITLSELLRATQFYNSRNGYFACEGSEDGYCPLQ